MQPYRRRAAAPQNYIRPIHPEPASQITAPENTTGQKVFAHRADGLAHRAENNDAIDGHQNIQHMLEQQQSQAIEIGT